MINDQFVTGQSEVKVKRIAVNSAITTTVGQVELDAATASSKLVISNVKVSPYMQICDATATDVFTSVELGTPVVTNRLTQSGVMVMAEVPDSVTIGDMRVIGMFSANGTLIAVQDITSLVSGLTQDYEYVIEIALTGLNASVIAA